MNASTQSALPLIIDNPELQARHRRMAYSAFTLVAWSIWMYLWLPLISLVAWIFGVRRFAHEIVVPELPTLLVTFTTYIGVVTLLVIVVAAWSQYNLRRFGPRGLRKASAPATDAEIAASFSLPPESLPEIRHAGSQLARFDADGSVRFEIRAPLVPAGA